MNNTEKNIVISDHAVIQYLKRFGGIEARYNKIRKVIAFGIEVKPKKKMMKLLNNKCKEARYYLYGDVVVVLEGDVVKTAYRYIRDKWEKLEKR